MGGRVCYKLWCPLVPGVLATPLTWARCPCPRACLLLPAQTSTEARGRANAGSLCRPSQLRQITSHNTTATRKQHLSWAYNPEVGCLMRTFQHGGEDASLGRERVLAAGAGGGSGGLTSRRNLTVPCANISTAAMCRVPPCPWGSGQVTICPGLAISLQGRPD